MKEIKINAPDYDTAIDVYIGIWNYAFELTKTENKVLKEIIKVFVALEEKGLEMLLFSTEFTSIYKKNLDISSRSLSQYKKKLLDVQALIEKDGIIYVNPVLIPRDSLTFTFDGIEQKKQEGLRKILEEGVKETLRK